MAAIPQQRGSYARGRATREEIVKVARDVLVERGYHGMTFVAVAKRAGLTRAGLIHHFPTKEHLLLAVMEHRFTDMRAWFEGELLAGTPVLDIFVELMRRQTADPAQGTLLLALSGASIDSSHPAHDWYGDRYAYMRARLSESIGEDQRRELITTARSADVIAVELVGMSEGVLLQWLHSTGDLEAVAVIRGYCDSLRPPLS